MSQAQRPHDRAGIHTKVPTIETEEFWKLEIKFLQAGLELQDKNRHKDLHQG